MSGLKRKDKAGMVLKEPARKFVCIICPNCCPLETDGSSVIGARCDKGEAFSLQEWMEPRRVLTTTVRCNTEKGVYVLPVKTASSVPLSQLPEIMKRIKAVCLSNIPSIGSKIPVNGPTEMLELIVTGE